MNSYKLIFKDNKEKTQFSLDVKSKDSINYKFSSKMPDVKSAQKTQLSKLSGRLNDVCIAAQKILNAKITNLL